MKHPPLSRRRFLQTTASTALAAPFLLPSAIRAAQTAANDRITLGFIGMGKQNRGLLNGFLGRSGTQVVAVCEVDKTRRDHSQIMVNDHYARKSGADNYKGCDAYNDFRELLDRKDIDAVVIATPDHWHAIPVIRAAQAGKDIYCEKPLSLTIHEADQMVKAVRKHDRVFQTGSQQRSSDRFRKACELVRNGRIGKIKTVHVAVGGPSSWCDLPENPAPQGLDWDLWLGPAPERGWNEVLSPVGVHDHFPHWRAYREYSGGGMTDWGAHHFDIAQWGLGKDGSGPVKILPPGKDREHLTYIYDDGVEMYHTSNGNGVTFTGTDGTIFVNRSKLEISGGVDQEIQSGEIRLYDSNDHLGNWLDCVRSRKRPICDVGIGASSVIICHLGNLAYWHEQPMQWDPDTLQFKNGTGSRKWLDTDRRDPWNLPKV